MPLPMEKKSSTHRLVFKKEFKKKKGEGFSQGEPSKEWEEERNTDSHVLRMIHPLNGPDPCAGQP